ncbi:MAG TPA: hypothetical protein VHP11_07495 [Tepidisphaeraceae bacterium]|nr:hypothetical protein [Tepidisphaeraceae bacterium]
MVDQAQEFLAAVIAGDFAKVAELRAKQDTAKLRAWYDQAAGYMEELASIEAEYGTAKTDEAEVRQRVLAGIKVVQEARAELQLVQREAGQVGNRLLTLRERRRSLQIQIDAALAEATGAAEREQWPVVHSRLHDTT